MLEGAGPGAGPGGAPMLPHPPGLSLATCCSGHEYLSSPPQVHSPVRWAHQPSQPCVQGAHTRTCMPASLTSPFHHLSVFFLPSY